MPLAFLSDFFSTDVKRERGDNALGSGFVIGSLRKSRLLPTCELNFGAARALIPSVIGTQVRAAEDKLKGFQP